MLLSELLKKAKIEYDGSDCEIKKIVYDSRFAEDKTVFVCIRGFASDGHAYAARAYAAGCRVFIAEQTLELPSDATVLYEENTRISLAKVSASFYGFPAEKLKVIGITGTKGKTTSALMIYSVLNKNGIPAGYIGSNGIDFAGNHYDTKNTTPESYELHYYFDLMIKAGIKVAVIEVSSQALYLDRVYGISFEAVAFTNLAHDHIGGIEHPTFEHYRDCKKKLFADYPSKFAVCNADDAYSDYMMKDCRALINSYGLKKGDFQADGIEPFMEKGALGVKFSLCYGKNKYAASLPMPGEFSVYNALCATAIAYHLGVPVDKCVSALADTYVNGRFEIVRTPLPTVFVIDYAHNGFSLTSALTTLRAYSPNKLFCVVGSVGGRTETRRGEIGEAISKYSDVAVLTADNPDFEDVKKICDDIHSAFVRDIPCEIFTDRADAIHYVVSNAKQGDIVLLAGKGHEQYQTVRGGKLPFSERSLVEKYAMEIAVEMV